MREVFLTDKEDYMLNLHIYEESCLIHKTLNQVIKEHDQLGFVVVFIKRGELKIKKDIYHTKIHDGDQILLFGDKKVIIEKFKNEIKIMEKKFNKHKHVPTKEY